jgi:hypothetical protein
MYGHGVQPPVTSMNIVHTFPSCSDLMSLRPFTPLDYRSIIDCAGVLYMMGRSHSCSVTGRANAWWSSRGCTRPHRLPFKVWSMLFIRTLSSASYPSNQVLLLEPMKSLLWRHQDELVQRHRRSSRITTNSRTEPPP